MAPSNSPAATVNNRPSSLSSPFQVVGLLQQLDASDKVVKSIRLFAGQELIIGRDSSRCQYVVDDPVISNKHLRLYSVLYDSDDPAEIAPLVYAEDLSRNGTFWNHSLIGKGNGGFLLSDGDSLRISSRTLFIYKKLDSQIDGELFDLVQEQEMKRFRREYIVTDRILGAGSFGRVHMAIEQIQKTQLACKVVDLRKLQPPQRMRAGGSEQPAAAEDVDDRLQLVKVKSWGQRHKRDNQLEEKLRLYHREAEILASLSHPNIIGLEKVYITDNSLYIFQDLITAGDLFSYISLKNGKLLDVETAVIVRQILIALVYLHEKNIVHRDLKPENILMTTLASGCRVVLTDFGCARRIENHQKRMSTLMGSEGFIAPEILQRPSMNVVNAGYTQAVDLWSLGCVSVVLLTGGHPFFEVDPSEYSEKLATQGNLTRLEKSPEWQDVGARPKAFVRSLLVLDERHRMTARQSLKHEWFTNDAHKTDFEELYRRSIKHWRPRMSKSPVIELIQAGNLKRLSFLQNPSSNSNQRGRSRGPTPVDPPYKPFPKRLNQTSFFPKRKTPSFANRMTDDVKSAIERNWTLDRTSTSLGLLSEDELRPQPAPRLRQPEDKSGLQSVTLSTPRTSRVCVHVPATPPSRKLRFEPLRPKEPPRKSPGFDEDRAGTENQASSGDLTLCDASRIFSALNASSNDGPRQTALAPNNNAGLTLPTRPLTPRPPPAYSNHDGSNLSVDSWLFTTEVLQSSRYFPSEDCLPVDKENKPMNVLARQDKKRDPVLNRNNAHTTASDYNSSTRSIQSFDSAGTDLICEPPAASKVRLSVPDMASNSSEEEVSPSGTIDQKGGKLRSPWYTLDGVRYLPLSNIKKRRRNSVFDFEEDVAVDPLVQGKKQKIVQEDGRHKVAQHESRASVETVLDGAGSQQEYSEAWEDRTVPPPPDCNRTLYLPRI